MDGTTLTVQRIDDTDNGWRKPVELHATAPSHPTGIISLILYCISYVINFVLASAKCSTINVFLVVDNRSLCGFELSLYR